MRPALALGVFGLVLAAAFGGGAAAGGLAGPISVGDGDPHGGHDVVDAPASDRLEAPGGDHGGLGGDAAPAENLPAGGLLVAQDGLRMVAHARTAQSGPFTFRIVDDDNVAVTEFVELHEREMHLIVASRDLKSFRHLHPKMDHDGRWSVDLPELPPGAHRAFADFQPKGSAAMTLGIDITVPGPTQAPEPLTTSTTDEVDGYQVQLDGDLAAAGEAELTVTVRKDGQVVTTEPYLGAGGHLVALRDGDLAFLHVHPIEEGPDGSVRFAVTAPSAGTYALFFDFQHDGEVRTAHFVLETRDTVPASPPHGDDH